MCGLLAGSGDLKPEVITALGCMNVSRGKDSAGIGWQDGDRVTFEKVAAHPLAAFPITLKKAIRKAAASGVCIGHTRAATQGKVTARNAHPFMVDGILFAHNGIIQNDEKFGKFQVDSESLIFGIKRRDFSKYVGSIALVWIEGGKLYAYRKGNPLYRGLLDGGLYLASERSFLERVRCKKIQELPEGTLLCFDKGKLLTSKRIPQNRVYPDNALEVIRPSTSYTPDMTNWPDNDMDLAGLNPDDPE